MSIRKRALLLVPVLLLVLASATFAIAGKEAFVAYVV